MKKTITLLTLACFLTIHNNSFGQWTEINDKITPSFINSCVAYNNKIYFTGGPQTDSVTSTIYNSKVEILDLETEMITTASGGLSVGRGAISCAALEDKIYFGGGYKFANNAAGAEVFDFVDVYDVATGTWDTLYLSVARGYGAVAVVGGKIMFAGGVTVVNNLQVVTNVVDIYDPVENKWTDTLLSQARADFQAGVVGNKAWFCGGASDWNGFIASKRVDVYDADNNIWDTTELLKAREAVAVTTAGRFLLCAGGYNNSNLTEGKTDHVDILNTATGVWKPDAATLSAPRMGIAAATLGDKAYFTGGGNFNISTGFLDTSTNIVDIFDSTVGEWGEWSTDTLNKNRTVHTCAAGENKIAVGGGWRAEQEQTTGSVEILMELVAVKDISRELNVSVFPNPVTDQITIEFPNNFHLQKKCSHHPHQPDRPNLLSGYF